MEKTILKMRTNELLSRLRKSGSSERGDDSTSSYEPTIFDTALVASLYCYQNQPLEDPGLPLNGKPAACFPEAFRYLLTQQQADGGWDAGMSGFKIGNRDST
jgi:hypothetical protein